MGGAILKLLPQHYGVPPDDVHNEYAQRKTCGQIDAISSQLALKIGVLIIVVNTGGTDALNKAAMAFVIISIINTSCLLCLLGVLAKQVGQAEMLNKVINWLFAVNVVLDVIVTATGVENFNGRNTNDTAAA